MDIVFLFKALWKKKWFLIIIPLIAGVTAFFLTLDSKKMYRSTAQLSTGFTTNDRFNISGEKINIYEIDIKFNNLIETFNSPMIVGLLSYNLILHDLNESPQFRTPDDNPQNRVNLTPIEKEKAMEVFQKKLDKFELLTSFNDNEKTLLKLLRSYGYDHESIMRDLRIRRLNYSDYILVEYHSENPLLSAFVVNTISQEFIRYNNSLNTNISGQSVEFYSNLVNKTKEVLDQKTLDLNTFKSTNNVVNVEVESETKFNQLADFELRREVEAQNIQKYQLELNNINKQLASLGDGGSSSASRGGRDNKKIAELQSKIKEGNARYLSSGKDPDILEALQDLRKQLNEETAKSDIGGGGGKSDKRGELLSQKNTAELNLQVAQSNLAQINSTIRNLKSNVSGLTTKGTTLFALTREVEKANEEYLAALEKYNSSKNEAMISTTSIKQVIYGQPATQHEPSKIIIFTALAIAVSFSLCLFTIIGLEYFDFSIRTPSNFEPSTKLESLGYVNEIKADTITPEIFNRKSGKDNGLYLYKELLKKLRFEIENSGGKIFLFTSTKPGEGKSSLIISLACTLTSNNRSILIIDTNFKNNTLTKLFSAKPTLESSINRELPIEELVTKTNYKNLDIIGCKGGNYSPTEIFPEKKFQALLSRLISNYDYIFLEGSSLNQFADCKELVSFADKVIPVFSSTSAIKQPDRQSISYLKSLNGKLMGSILNRVEADNLEH